VYLLSLISRELSSCSIQTGSSDKFRVTLAVSLSYYLVAQTGLG
jgi:hypothetical protein